MTLIRHQLGASLLDALRHEGLGIRDLFEGRQEPLSWLFRGLAYDQSELDILESGAVETLHIPSALVELAVDEMALACANLGLDGVAAYLNVAEETEEGEARAPSDLRFHPSTMLAFLNLDVAPPARWLEQREADPDANEELAGRLAAIAREVGGEADAVEVHIEGAVDEGAGWAEAPAHIRPAGVSIYFSFEIPLEGADERELARIFGRGARTVSAALEEMRSVFREG